MQEQYFMKKFQTFALTFEKLFLNLSQASRLGVSWLVITNHIMNNLRKSISLMAAVTMIAACANTGKKDIIGENIQNAEVQLSALCEESQKDDTLRIPQKYQNGKVDFVSIYDWVSGFPAGEFWYMYDLTKDEKWADEATKFTEVLAPVQFYTGNHDVGFMINDSYGLGLKYKNREEYVPVIINTAKSLITRYKPNAKIIQSWNANPKKGWVCPVIIDNMMNLELLFNATELSGDSTYYRIAVEHAETTMKNHFRNDYSTWHVVDYDPETGAVRGKYTAQGYSDESAWARGQAWGLYGYTAAYRHTHIQKFLDQAEKIENFIFTNKNMPEDLVPYWDYDCPDIPNTPRDASSASIMASALYDLYSITGKEDYLKKADKIIESLSSPAYRAEHGTNGGFILMHSVTNFPANAGVDVPLNYADYYFLEALIRKRDLKK